MAKALYKLGQLVEYNRDDGVKTVGPEREIVAGVLSTDKGYEYKLIDGTFISESSVQRAYVQLKGAVKARAAKKTATQKKPVSLTGKSDVSLNGEGVKSGYIGGKDTHAQ